VRVRTPGSRSWRPWSGPAAHRAGGSRSCRTCRGTRSAAWSPGPGRGWVLDRRHRRVRSLAAVGPADAVPVPDALDLPTATALLADGRTAMGLHWPRRRWRASGCWSSRRGRAGQPAAAAGAGGRGAGTARPAAPPAGPGDRARRGRGRLHRPRLGRPGPRAHRRRRRPGVRRVGGPIGGAAGAWSTRAGARPARPGQRHATDTAAARERGVTVLGFERLRTSVTRPRSPPRRWPRPWPAGSPRPSARPSARRGRPRPTPTRGAQTLGKTLLTV